MSISESIQNDDMYQHDNKSNILYQDMEIIKSNRVPLFVISVEM